jgi:TatD DNase family protein
LTMLIDTHAHLYWDSFKEDWDEVIKRCKESGVEIIFNIGVDIEKSKLAEEIESDKLKFYSTIGIHPHEAAKYSKDPDKLISEDIRTLEEIYHKNPKKVVGIGECGLDYFFDAEFIPPDLTIIQLKDLQRKLFLSQIELSKKLNLPLSIHCRDDRSKNPQNTECWLEALDLIKDTKVILHCYSGMEEITKKALELNCLFSFAANITYPKNDYLKEAVKIIPLEKIALETDCPFLAPQSKRGKRNEPSSVKEIADLIAEIKGVSFEEVADQTTGNVKKLFNIS